MEKNDFNKIKIRINSEYGLLREAIIGYYKNYYRKDLIKLLQKEMENLKSTLRMHNVKVHEPDEVQGLNDQVTPRDIGFVIGNKFFISSMVERRRQNEWKGIMRIIKRIDGEIIKAPPNVFIEGGDILIDGNTVFVGLGERTNAGGLNFLKEKLKDEYTLYPVKINALHLDVVLNIIARDLVLCYFQRIKEIPSYIKEKFALIETTRKEFGALCINALSIGNGRVLVRKGFDRINNLLRDHGLDVIEISFTVIPRKGGGIRCTVLPLRRE